MERFNNKPSLGDIFYALASEESPDWCMETLKNADPKDRAIVTKILKRGLPFSEADFVVRKIEGLINQ